MRELKAVYQRFYFPYNHHYYPFMEDLKTEEIEVDATKWGSGDYYIEHSDGILGNQGGLIFEGDIVSINDELHVVHFHDRLGTFIINYRRESASEEFKTDPDTDPLSLTWITDSVIEAAKKTPYYARRVDPVILRDVIKYNPSPTRTLNVHYLCLMAQIDPARDRDIETYKKQKLLDPYDLWLFFHPDKKFVYPLADQHQHTDEKPLEKPNDF